MTPHGAPGTAPPAGPAAGLFEIDDVDPDLSFMPLAVRRALDHTGLRLSLEGWGSLPYDTRIALLRIGASERVNDDEARRLLAPSGCPPTEQLPDPPAAEPPAALVAAVGAGLAPRWGELSPLARWALWKLHTSGRVEKLGRLWAELSRPTHVDDTGAARMVSVAEKPVTHRVAAASARVRMRKETLATIAQGSATKGDVLAVARVAGIQAAKRTPDLIPLCHAVALTRVNVNFEVDHETGELRVLATAEAMDRTGVEMEAMVAASVAALTVYDMVKGIDRWVTIERVQLDLKTGGRSGRLSRGER